MTLAVGAAKGDCTKLLSDLEPTQSESFESSRMNYLNLIRWLVLDRGAIDLQEFQEMLKSESAPDPMGFLNEALSITERGALRPPMEKLLKRIRAAGNDEWAAMKKELRSYQDQKESQIGQRQTAVDETRFIYFPSKLENPASISDALFYYSVKAKNGDYYLRGDRDKTEPLLVNFSTGQVYPLGTGSSNSRIIEMHILQTSADIYFTKADANSKFENFALEAINVSNGEVLNWDIKKLFRQKNIRFPEIPLAHVYEKKDGKLGIAVISRAKPGLMDTIYMGLEDSQKAPRFVTFPEASHAGFLRGAAGEFFYVGLNSRSKKVTIKNLAVHSSSYEHVFGEEWTSEPAIEMARLGDKRWILLKFDESAYYYDVSEKKVFPLSIGLKDPAIHYHDGQIYLSTHYPGAERAVSIRSVLSGQNLKLNFGKSKSGDVEEITKRFISMKNGALALSLVIYSGKTIKHFHVVDVKSGGVQTLDLSAFKLAKFFGIKETEDGRLVAYFWAKDAHKPVAIQVYGPPPGGSGP
jgi:hypothetical protein